MKDIPSLFRQVFFSIRNIHYNSCQLSYLLLLTNYLSSLWSTIWNLEPLIAKGKANEWRPISLSFRTPLRQNLTAMNEAYSLRQAFSPCFSVLERTRRYSSDKSHLSISWTIRRRGRCLRDRCAPSPSTRFQTTLFWPMDSSYPACTGLDVPFSGQSGQIFIYYWEVLELEKVILAAIAWIGLFMTSLLIRRFALLWEVENCQKGNFSLQKSILSPW